jgi:hypothetical protein
VIARTTSGNPAHAGPGFPRELPQIVWTSWTNGRPHSRHPCSQTASTESHAPSSDIERQRRPLHRLACRSLRWKRCAVSSALSG